MYLNYCHKMESRQELYVPQYVSTSASFIYRYAYLASYCLYSPNPPYTEHNLPS